MTTKTKTTLKNGMLYHVISKELYIKHKADGWPDRRVMARYGMNAMELSNWKKENFSQDEIKNMNLRKGTAVEEKPKEKKPEVTVNTYEKEYRQALAELDQLKYENEELARKLNLPTEENLKLQEQIVNQDYTIENHKNRIEKLLEYGNKLEHENKLLKELLKLWI